MIWIDLDWNGMEKKELQRDSFSRGFSVCLFLTTESSTSFASQSNCCTYSRGRIGSTSGSGRVVVSQPPRFSFAATATATATATTTATATASTCMSVCYFFVQSASSAAPIGSDDLKGLVHVLRWNGSCVGKRESSVRFDYWYCRIHRYLLSVLTVQHSDCMYATWRYCNWQSVVGRCQERLQ